MRALPHDIPEPDLAADPDGAVSLDWYTSRGRRFSVSIGASGGLAYAWLDGGQRGHAVGPFDGVSIPARVLDDIRRISRD